MRITVVAFLDIFLATSKPSHLYPPLGRLSGHHNQPPQTFLRLWNHRDEAHAGSTRTHLSDMNACMRAVVVAFLDRLTEDGARENGAVHQIGDMGVVGDSEYRLLGSHPWYAFSLLMITDEFNRAPRAYPLFGRRGETQRVLHLSVLKQTPDRGIIQCVVRKTLCLYSPKW